MSRVLIRVLSLAAAVLAGPGCADEYGELYGSCPEDGDCFFNAAQWKRIETLTCLDCEPEFPSGPAPAEPSNEFAASDIAIELGSMVFRERALSGNGKTCMSCHEPATWFTSVQEQSDEVRNITSAINAAYYDWHLWHGGKDSLWSQALGPIEKNTLLDGNRLRVVRFIAGRPRYAEKFAMLGDFPALDEFPACPPTHAECKKVFDALPDTDPRIEVVNRAFADVGKVLAAYMYTLTSGATPFDQYVRREGEISDRAKRGLAIFIGKGNCITCHSGPTLSDQDFHNIGLQGEDPEDPDRLDAIEALPSDPWFTLAGPFATEPTSEGIEALEPVDGLEGAFRTPSLRNVERTGPYMRNGEFLSLEEVVYHYVAPEPNADGLDEDIWPLELTSAEVGDLVAFLRTLTEVDCRWNGDNGCP